MILKSTTLIVFVVLVIAFCPGTLQAQFSAGLKAGMNMSTLEVDDEAGDYGYSPGFQVGAFLDYNLTKVSFQADVLYSKQGATIKANGEDLTAVAKYVNVPIVVRYKITPSITASLGPQVGFLTCMESDYHPVINGPFEEQDYTKAYKKTDFGVTLGGGWESAKGISVEVRYYLGMTDISDYTGVESTKNRVLQLTVGYKIFKF